MRMCAGCREMKRKSELIRIVLSDGGARCDPTGKANGRGVYVCRNSACITKLQKSRKSRLAGGSKVPDSVFSELLEMISDEQ